MINKQDMILCARWEHEIFLCPLVSWKLLWPDLPHGHYLNFSYITLLSNKLAK